tara:strand:- start:114 stop:401 length:288 start_codon:yes stop_codon:yes gene_type:complete
MQIVIDPKYLEVFEKTPSKFGTGAHIIISKEHLNKKIKIICGKSKLIGKKLQVDLFNSEIFERKASKFGTGCHVIIPKKYSGKKIKIIIENRRKK